MPHSSLLFNNIHRQDPPSSTSASLHPTFCSPIGCFLYFSLLMAANGCPVFTHIRCYHMEKQPGSPPPRQFHIPQSKDASIWLLASMHALSHQLSQEGRVVKDKCVLQGLTSLEIVD